jgi:tyrosyl-tRNA synthetase
MLHDFAAFNAIFRTIKQMDNNDFHSRPAVLCFIQIYKKRAMKKSDFSKTEELLQRGVVEINVREHLEERIKKGEKLRIKFGIDPTGPDIHLGNAIPIRKLRQFQELGHQIVFLIGDFTARIGDTSDKTAIRQPMSEEEIAENMKTYKKQLAKILDLDKTEFVYNSEWLDKLTHKEILKLQSLFTVAQMVERENFQGRFKEKKPIGLQELSYPLMQGYDSVAIKADVEIGGTDQTFNMMAGRDIQRAFGQEPQDVMTLRLLEGTDGRKMSKSYGNIIKIMDEPNDMYGKIMSMKDELMIDYFVLCTDISMEEIKEIEKELKEKRVNPRDIKARLAKEIVKIYHGEKFSQDAEKEFDRIFRDRELPAEMPEIKLEAGQYDILDLLVKVKMSPSKAEAKRLILQGGIKIEGKEEKDWHKKISIRKGEEINIKAGKRKFIRISA